MVVTRATEQVIETLRARAAKIWKIDIEAVVWENGKRAPPVPMPENSRR